MPKGAPAREGSAVFDAAGVEVGTVTSGGYSPCLKKGVGMCYVPPHLMKAGTELTVEVRRQEAEAAPHPLPSRHPRYPYPRAPIRHLPPLVRSVARSSPSPSPRCPSSPPTTTAAPERWLGGEWPWALGALGVAWVVSARVALAHGPRGMEGSRARVEYAAVGGTAAHVASATSGTCVRGNRLQRTALKSLSMV